MSWVRIHDGAMTHPKIVGLSDKAFRLWVWGLSYCQQHLTDGLIVHRAIPRGSRVAVDHLSDAGLWEAHPSGFLIHDYLEWNDSRELVTRKRDEAKDRMSRARERSRELTRNPTQSTSQEVLRRVGLGSPGSVVLKEEKKDLLEARFDEFWQAYPRKIGKGAAWTAFRKLQPDSDLLGRILASIQAHRSDSQWLKEGGQFIPHPSTFLTQRRFEDELSPPAPQLSQQVSHLARAVAEFNASPLPETNSRKSLPD